MTNMVIINRRMMQTSVLDLLAQWPDRNAVFEDARAADPALKIVAVHRWFQRGSVPSKFWAALVAGAGRRGLSVSADHLMHAHAANDAPYTERAG